ncbi:MAG: phosphatase PAP2 family protein [bacterium]
MILRKIAAFIVLFLLLGGQVYGQETKPLEEKREKGFYGEIWKRVTHDYGNFYAGPGNLLKMSLGVGAASLMANTSADQNFRNWYKDNHRNGRTDDFSKLAKLLGEGKYLVPLSLGTAILGETLLRDTGASRLGNWGEKTARAYLVGAPAVLLLQRTLGASRPDEHEESSSEKQNRKKRNSAYRFWNDNNGVSGHAFVGAVPFITAAQMTDRLYGKITCYLLSGLAAFSRVNDDAHYLSQSLLGWSLAYLSAESVFTDNEDYHISLNFLANFHEYTYYGLFVTKYW